MKVGLRHTFPKGAENPGFKPGQSGNPAGRPRGSRNKLGEAFLTDLYNSWLERGKEVIDAVIASKPEVYLKVVASLLPKEFNIKSDEAMSEEQIDGIIAAIRAEQIKREQVRKQQELVAATLRPEQRH